MSCYRAILLVFGLVVLCSMGCLLSVQATGDNQFYKDARSREERSHQELEKARCVAEERESRLVALRAMGDSANRDDLKLAEDLFKAASASVVRAEERYESAVASTSRIAESLAAPASTSAGPRTRTDDDSNKEEVQDRKGKKRMALEDLPREIKPPAGGWFDKHGTVHRANALACETINNRLATAWINADAIVKLQDLCLPSAASLPSALNAPSTSTSVPIVDASDDASVIATGVTLMSTALTAITGLIYNYSEDGKKLHVSHKCGPTVAKHFEEDDPLRQGADGERLKRAMKVAEQEENKKRKSSGAGSGSGRSSNRPSGDFRSSLFSDRRASRPSGGFDSRDRGRDRGGDFSRKCFICGGSHLANECPKKKK
jgi:hypothetical protein